MKFGKLSVTGTFRKKRNPRGYRLMAICLCDCGINTTVQFDNLKSGHTTSCGCHKSESKKTHGYSRHPLYGVWEGIINRCLTKTSSSFKYYGGRGILVCDKWRNPKEFIEWALDNGYQRGLTIDRIDVNGNYEPLNCRFVTPEHQAKNTRKAMKLEAIGKIDTQRGWAKYYGVHPATLRYRMNTKGMTLSEAVSNG
jgi:hypothetical protein